MSESITSLPNKELLWNLMYENGTFNGISETKIVDVQNIFERTVQKIDSSSNGTITQKNKEVLVTMLNEVKNIKSVVLITADDISRNRREIFDRNLNARENELKEMLEIKPPQEVDFSDKPDEPMRGSMDDLLHNIISKREKEMNTVFQDNTHSDNNKTELKNKTIKIGKSLSKDDGRQLHFEILPSSVEPIPPSSNNEKHQTQSQSQTENQMESVMKLLEAINSKQDTILEKLNAAHE